MLLPLGTTQGRSTWTVTAPDGRTFAVFLLPGGTLRVTDAQCPHRRGPLAEGRLRGPDRFASADTITCPWHGYRFSLETGACLTTPRYTLAVHPVVDVAGEPRADVGEPG